MKTKRKFGRFILQVKAIDEHIDEVFSLMKNVVVTDTHWNWANQTVEYTAWSPLFDEVELGYEIPLYTAVFVTEVSGSEENPVYTGVFSHFVRQ